MPWVDTEPHLCQATVYKRDTYRYTGGKRRYKMHYTRDRCCRRACKDGWCWQHAGMKGLSRWA
jgi:hypothetical protein